MNPVRITPWNWFRREEESVPARARRVVAVPQAPLYMELDRLFDNLFNGYFPQAAAPKDVKELGEAMIRPNLDISGDDQHYFITVELPGVDENDLHVEVDKGTLRISGVKKYEHEQKDENENGRSFYRIERSYGSFQRMLALPEDVDPSSITANHKDGVLTITLPRREEELSHSRRIQIGKE